MDIRDWNADDAEAIWAINEAEVPAVGSVASEALTAIADQAEIALVAEHDGVIGGFCLVLGPGATYQSANYAWFSDRYDRFIYLDRIAIAPSFQRQGWGRSLYEAVERRAAELSPLPEVWTLEVNLVPRNDVSLAFHAGLGFTEVGVRTPRPDHSVSMMVKPLAPPDDGARLG